MTDSNPLNQLSPQVLRAVLENPCDTTRFSLIYAARVPEDLLLREELDAWAEQYEQFTVRNSVLDIWSQLPLIFFLTRLTNSTFCFTYLLI